MLTGKLFTTRELIIVSVMFALTIVLMVTPFGTIRLPLVAITIAHIPTIVTALILGPVPGLFVGVALGVSSMFTAITSPTGILDPFFMNPLVSVLPRALIPLTAYFSYKTLRTPLKYVKGGEYLAIGTSVAIGNLTNTFGVYAMLYLVYASQIFEKTGTPALSLIIAAISTTTVIKCIGVVIICLPIVAALNKVKQLSLGRA